MFSAMGAVLAEWAEEEFAQQECATKIKEWIKEYLSLEPKDQLELVNSLVKTILTPNSKCINEGLVFSMAHLVLVLNSDEELRELKKWKNKADNDLLYILSSYCSRNDNESELINQAVLKLLNSDKHQADASKLLPIAVHNGNSFLTDLLLDNKYSLNLTNFKKAYEIVKTYTDKKNTLKYFTNWLRNGYKFVETHIVIEKILADKIKNIETHLKNIEIRKTLFNIYYITTENNLSAEDADIAYKHTDLTGVDNDHQLYKWY